MKLKSLLLKGGLFCVLGIGSAHANPFTVYLSAHVTAVNDPFGLLAGIAGAPLTVGQVASGQYRYDTSIPNSIPGGPQGSYMPGSYIPGPGQTATRISIGSLVFQSDPQVGPPIGVIPGVPNPSFGQPAQQTGEIFIDSMNNVSPAPNFFVQDIRVDFQDPLGYAPSSNALPTDVPDLTAFSVATVTVTGNGMNAQGMGGPFSVAFTIDNVYVFPPSAATWSVSPATGVFSPQQTVDAVVLLPAGSQVQSVQMLIGGGPGPFGFPAPPPPAPPSGQCSLLPQNSKGQQGILCPNVLPFLQSGINQIDWQVQLMDGTTLDKVVVWELVP